MRQRTHCQTIVTTLETVGYILNRGEAVYGTPPPLSGGGTQGDYTMAKATEMKESDENVKLDLKGNILTITVDLSQDFGKSVSGKTTIIASTKGNIPIVGSINGAIMGLNIYKK